MSHNYLVPHGDPQLTDCLPQSKFKSLVQHIAHSIQTPAFSPQMEVAVSERFYSITEFSQKYCTCRSRVYEMLAQGELTAVKVGRSTRITEEAAEAWKASLSPYAPKSSLTKSTSHSNGADKR